MQIPFFMETNFYKKTHYFLFFFCFCDISNFFSVDYLFPSFFYIWRIRF